MDKMQLSEISKLRDVAYRIRASYLFSSETLQIFDYKDYHWLCFDYT